MSARPAAADAAPERTELWCHLAIVLLLVLAGALAYLGARPGGRGPLLVYNFGRDLLFVAAFLTLIFGVGRTLRRPPLTRPGRLRAMAALALVIGIAPYRLPYPSSREGTPSTTRFELPVRGTWRAYWGGDDKESNRLVGFFADRRYGLDLVREVDGARLRPGLPDGLPVRPEDFWSFGEPVHAPAAGRVVELRDGVPDSPLGGPPSAGSLAGNMLVLRIADDEYLFLTHLAAGSFEVSVDDDVSLGQPLARVGYSGFSPITPEPHVALHLQTTAEEGWGEGVPWRFHGYSTGGRAVTSGVPRGGVDADRGPVGELLVVEER